LAHVPNGAMFFEPKYCLAGNTGRGAM